MTLKELLQEAVDKNASDLHLLAKTPPAFRVDGKIEFHKRGVLTLSQLEAMCFDILSQQQERTLGEHKEVDFAFEIENLGRFRANFYFQQSEIAASFRILPTFAPDISSFEFAQAMIECCQTSGGLVLVSGSTGSGKTTTIASILEYINQNHNKHILTLEDPVEFVLTPKKSIISQRNIGEDSHNFASALKYAMRQDPDVILIGEIRDAHTMRSALMAAETGHLVIASLHANSAIQTINRVLGFFDANEQASVRSQLSMSLKGILSQALLPRVKGGRALASELLLATVAVANLIREDKISQIHSQMQIGQSSTQMHTLEQSVLKLLKLGVISQETASSIVKIQS